MKTKTQTMKKLRTLAFASVLTLIGVGVAPAQNLILNGDFTANAAAFAAWPGVINYGGNPATITDWGNPLAGQIGLNGRATGASDVFGPVNPAGQTYAFMQGGATAFVLDQGLPAAYTTNATYQFSFDAAARAGNSSVTFQAQIADNSVVHVGTGNLIANPAEFTHYSYTFTSPATFDGAPSVQLWNLTGGDNTVAFANVSLVALPLPASTNLLADNFNTADTLNLDDNLATRESGVLAPVSGFYTEQDSLADIIEIQSNALVMTRVDSSGSFITRASPNQNFFSYEVNNSFTVTCDVTPPAAGADTWSAVTVRGGSALQSVLGNCFAMLLRPGGGYSIFDGATDVGDGSLNASTNNSYHVVISVNDNVVSIFVNQLAVSFGNGQYTYLIANAINGNYVSFINYAGSTSVPATATFDNFAISVVPLPVLPSTVVLADNFTTADSASLNNNLLTRQSGTAATQTWATAQNNGAAFAISSDSLSITNTGDTSITNSFGTAFPNLDLRPYERFGSFHVSVAVSPVVGAGDSWGAVKVRQSDPTQWILNGNGFGVLVRPGGSWGVTDGGNVEFTGFITPATTYLVDIEVITNMAYVKINGATVASGYALSSTQAVNYVSLMSNAGIGSSGVAATFNNFEFDALGTYAGLPAPSLVNTISTAGTVSSQFSSVANAAYIWEYKNNLTDPVWTALYNIIGTGGTLTVTNATPGTPQRFYRLHVP